MAAGAVVEAAGAGVEVATAAAAATIIAIETAEMGATAVEAAAAAAIQTAAGRCCALYAHLLERCSILLLVTLGEKIPHHLIFFVTARLHERPEPFEKVSSRLTFTRKPINCVPLHGSNKQ